MGGEVTEFERRLAEFCGIDYRVRLYLAQLHVATSIEPARHDVERHLHAVHRAVVGVIHLRRVSPQR